ncbi:hypothetical protein V1477_012253 [Vespula maculifrons]|uniref:Uncharacterized protein n=1 Tax=Vespula maculifrons TaxID=7453 RepID=A0ABD2BWZ0_VESMC
MRDSQDPPRRWTPSGPLSRSILAEMRKRFRRGRQEEEEEEEEEEKEVVVEVVEEEEEGEEEEEANDEETEKERRRDRRGLTSRRDSTLQLPAVTTPTPRLIHPRPFSFYIGKEDEDSTERNGEKERERERERDRKIERKRERVGEETQFETSEFEYGRPQAETMGTSMDHTGCEQMSSANSLKFYSLDSLGISTINPYMFECSFYDPRGNVRGSVIDKGTSNSVLVDRKERTRYPDEEEEVEDEEEIGGGRRRTFCEIDTERRSYRAGPTRVTYYRVGTKSNTICAFFDLDRMLTISESASVVLQRSPRDFASSLTPA